ncbi:MAG: DUF3891 family protein [Cyanosarcina radialis HA8281-LM2]|jgi:hypothetical protein|nr:DUF3891 family protein [Cyanosarcina radialis HA8281-LM2]
MIVNLVENGWEIIYHRAHALLAAKIAGQWSRKETPVRLYETIAAISHHDDLEREWEGNHLTEAGAPLDFTLDKDSSVAQFIQLIDGARYRGRWVAMLVSMHICFLNQHRRGQSAEWDDFFKTQLKRQEEWRKGLGIDKDEAERAYQFMHWCDRLSLILTQKQLPAGQRWLEITSGLDGVRYEVMQQANGDVTIQPWPFEAKRFQVSVDASHLTQLKFKSSEELAKALQQAPLELLEWTFVKSNS